MKIQFNEFLDKTEKQYQEEFLSFNMKFQCVDKFYGKWLH